MLFSWVLFRADNLTMAVDYFQAMFGVGEVGPLAPLIAAHALQPLPSAHPRRERGPWSFSRSRPTIGLSRR